MILVSGFNVYPNEIEDVVMQHSGVLEVCGGGRAFRQQRGSGEDFCGQKRSFTHRGSADNVLSSQLTGYKVPKLVEFRDELPKSNVGKILRRELRDEARAKVDNKA